MARANDEEPASPAKPAETTIVFGYFTALTLIALFVTPLGSLAQIPIKFYLKDRLHFQPEAIAHFQFLINAPVYVAFLFGLIRDRWSPFGLRDRGFFLLFAPIAAIAYVMLALRHGTYQEMLLGVFTIMLVYRMIGPAVAGLSATVGQRLRMTGRLSSLVQFVANGVAAGLSYLGGWFSAHVSPQATFLTLAGASICLFLLGLARPLAIFPKEREDAAHRRNFRLELRRLVRHRPLLPALLISLIWAFGPGQDTPLFFHLTKAVGMTMEQFGIYGSIGALAFLPGLAIYGFLCKRVDNRKLLTWATVFAVPQLLFLTAIHSLATAYLVSALAGVVGGAASAAYYDLLLRSCPKGFEGTTVELNMALSVAVASSGNVLGSAIYNEHGGFALCNWISAVAYALILPLILWIPKETTAMRDGEFQEEVQHVDSLDLAGVEA